jgi:type III restriction enzyme
MIGRDAAEVIRASLVEQKMLDADGRIQPTFDPRRKDFKLELLDEHRDLIPTVIDLLSSYHIERHIRRDRDEGPNRLKNEVKLGPEFQALWDHIKPKTTYRVEFETEVLLQRAVNAVKQMEIIETPRVRVTAGQVGIVKGGVTTTAISAAEEWANYEGRPVPDVLAYLQNETELTRSTLVRILKDSGRLAEFFNNPQLFMDRVAAILKYELHRLLVDGIKYERIEGAGADWEMLLFKNEELVNYLNALQVKNSVYEYVVYESEVERAFAQRLDEREDIKLFVKLPGWFKIETPLGEYNPDWAIVKHQDKLLYLVRETKATRNFLKLRTSEADKVRCGERHFEAIGVPFAVAVTADEV